MSTIDLAQRQRRLVRRRLSFSLRRVCRLSRSSSCGIPFAISSAFVPSCFSIVGCSAGPPWPATAAALHRLDRLLPLRVPHLLGHLQDRRSRAWRAAAPAPRCPAFRSRTAARRRATSPPGRSRSPSARARKRTSGSGWFRPLTIAPTSRPAAAARTSSAGSIGGSNSGSCRKTPWRFRLLRILNSRSATVSQ